MASRLAGFVKSATDSLENAAGTLGGAATVLLIGWLSLQIGRGALHDLAATLKHLRCLVGKLPAALVHIPAAIQQIATGFGERVPAFLCLLRDLPPCMFARSRRV